jgi:hypothetical protein
MPTTDEGLGDPKSWSASISGLAAGTYVEGNPPVARGSRGRTYQVAPTLAECDYRLPNTPHREGMLVGLLDGSVRGLNPRIAESTFWALVTPDTGDIVGDF